MRSDAISIDSEVMGGAPCFAGARVPVKALFDYLEAGDGPDEFLDDFSSVKRDLAIKLLEDSRMALLAA